MSKGTSIEHKEIARLRKAVARLQKLALKYRQSEVIQKSLFKISELASSVSRMQDFYESVHAIIDDLMDAQNFFICLYHDASDTIEFVYFVDEYDDIPSIEHEIPAEVLGQGLTGYVMRTGQPFKYDEELYQSLLTKGEIRDLGAEPVDWLGVPLQKDGHVLGAMVVQSYTEDVLYSEADKELFMFVSQHIVTALERVQQRDMMKAEIERQTAKLRQINEELTNEISERERAERLSRVLFIISELTNTSDSMETFYQQLHTQIGELINNQNFFVALLDDDREHLEFPYYVDEYDNLKSKRSLSLGMTEYVIRHRQPIFIDEKNHDKLVAAGEIDHDDDVYGTRPKQWLGSPLVVDDEVIGVLSVQTYSDDTGYKQDDLELLNFVSQHVAVAIERRRNAEEVRRMNTYLERKVAERTEELVGEIEQRKKIEEKLYHDAHHDALTGLPNRSMFTERLQQTLKHKKRYPHHNFAVLFVDLDRFKNINDTLGHSAGDQFLLEASRRLGECIRDNDMLARLGGDEFVILLDMIRHIDDACVIADRIIETMKQPFVFGNHEHYSGASVGIAECKSRNDSAERLLRDADAAMYQAKNMGRGRFVVFNDSMHNELVNTINSETELRQAKFDRDFAIEQTAIYDLDKQSVIAHQLLPQWLHDGVMVSSERLTAMAEKTGMHLEVDQWHLTRCCEWLIENPEVAAVYTTVSAKHLYKLGDLHALMDIISESKVAPERLVLAFSESDLKHSSKRQLSCLRQLSEMGVGIALSDFGKTTGALQFILKYPFTHVMLDANFVANIAATQRSQIMVSNVVHLCRELGIEVAASGVVYEDQRIALVHNGVNIGLGRLYGEPKQISPMVLKGSSTKAAGNA